MKKIISILFLLTLSNFSFAEELVVFDRTYTDAGVVAGCDVRHMLSINESMNWSTSTICNGDIVASDDQPFSPNATKTWLYFLQKALSWSDYAKNNGIRGSKQLFSWDNTIIITVSNDTASGNTELIITNTGLVDDQATPIIIDVDDDAEWLANAIVIAMP